MATASRGRESVRGDRGAGDPLFPLLTALQAAESGDFSVRLPVGDGNVMLDRIAHAFNALAHRNATFTDEMVRVERVVGREGRMGERVTLGDVRGGWATSVNSINALIGDLVRPTTEVARVLVAVAEGDLTQKMALEIDGQPVKGEFLRIGTTVNTMVDQLSAFASEVTRVAKEVGSDGKLGGQAEVKGVSGTWKDLTDNVNIMAVEPDRPGAKHRRGDHGGGQGRPVQEDHGGRQGRGARAEGHHQHDGGSAELVRRRSDARRQGSGHGRQAGRSGGGAGRRGYVEGPHRQRELLAGNLTAQVRNIAEVTTAVAKGDLSQKITVDAQGRGAGAEEHHQHDGGSAQLASPPR